MIFFLSTERFYHAAHPNGHKSSSTGSGVTKCPFRAALQSKSLHTSSATSVPPAVQTKSHGEVKKTERNETSDESHQCKCVVDGLTPKGVCMHVTIMCWNTIRTLQKYYTTCANSITNTYAF